MEKNSLLERCARYENLKSQTNRTPIAEEHNDVLGYLRTKLGSEYKTFSDVVRGR